MPHHHGSSSPAYLPSRRRRACLASIAATVSVIALSHSTIPGHAQQGPFASFSGSWAGNGTVKLASGSREQIKCRASYDTQSGGNSLAIALRCAGDSYNYDFKGTANHTDGKINGDWTESSKSASGRFSGVINGDEIAARIDLPSVTVTLNMVTRGERQSISIRSPGSEISEVEMALRRR